MDKKDRMANKLYGTDFELLSAGEKARVTREVNKASRTSSSRVVSRTFTSTDRSDFIKVEIGRVSVNGAKTCYMKPNDSVGDLLEQAGYTLNENESILYDGLQVSLADKVQAGSYVISFRVKSA